MATKQIAIAISGLLDDLGIREQTRGIKLRKKKIQDANLYGWWDDTVRK